MVVAFLRAKVWGGLNNHTLENEVEPKIFPAVLDP